MKHLERSREENCQGLLHLYDITISLWNMLKIWIWRSQLNRSWQKDYRWSNQSFDMLLLIMGPSCAISMWGVVGFIFRDLWKTVEPVLASDNGYNLLLKLHDNTVGSFEKFLVIVWKWAHQKWTGNAQQEQRFKWSCIFLLCCCSYSCLVLSAEKKENNVKLTVSF